MCSIPSNTITLGLHSGNIEGHYFFLTPDRIAQIDSLLWECMKVEKRYLTLGCGIRQLAKEIQIPAYQLSAFVNQKLGMNFNDYINRFRVKYCLELMQMGIADGLNMRGLAHRCGFSNRNTLTTSFKKFTGVSPSTFRRSIGDKDHRYIKMNESLVNRVINTTA
jgi:AraC-like DNA-binding protein